MDHIQNNWAMIVAERSHENRLTHQMPIKTSVNKLKSFFFLEADFRSMHQCIICKAFSFKSTCLYYQFHCGVRWLCSLEQVPYYSLEWWAIINIIMYDAEMLFNCNNKSQRLSLTTQISWLSQNIFWQFCTLYWQFRIFLTPRQRQHLSNIWNWYNFLFNTAHCFFLLPKCSANYWNCHWPKLNSNNRLLCWHVLKKLQICQLKSCHRLVLQSHLERVNIGSLAARFHALSGIIKVAWLSKTKLLPLGFLFVAKKC